MPEKHTMIYRIRFKTIKLKETTVDRNVANKMKRFLYTAWRNSLLLLGQSTRLWSSHIKSNRV